MPESHQHVDRIAKDVKHRQLPMPSSIFQDTSNEQSLLAYGKHPEYSATINFTHQQVPLTVTQQHQNFMAPIKEQPAPPNRRTLLKPLLNIPKDSSKNAQLSRRKSYRVGKLQEQPVSLAMG